VKLFRVKDSEAMMGYALAMYCYLCAVDCGGYMIASQEKQCLKHVMQRHTEITMVWQFGGV